MVPRIARTLLWATALLLPALTPPGALANGHHGGYAETVYYEPTSLVVPTTYSYAVPTSYVVPTTYSYYMPTVYTSTSNSYLAPTTYLSATEYVVPTTYTYRRRAARYAATSYSSYYVPTTYSYYVPTVYEYPVVATSAAVPLCNETTVPFAAPAAPRGASGGKGGINSTPTNGKKEPGLSNDAARAREQEAAGGSGGANTTEESVSPPPAAGANEGGGKGKVENPPEEFLPPPNEALPGAAGEPQAMLRRQARKPAADAGNLQLRPRREPRRSLLAGRVLSGATGQAEPGVKVVFANRGGRFEDRGFTSDAKGHFDVAYLPDGDWSVQVEDAAGKAVTFATLTVSGGRVTDDTGREWTSLTLNR